MFYSNPTLVFFLCFEYSRILPSAQFADVQSFMGQPTNFFLLKMTTYAIIGCCMRTDASLLHRPHSVFPSLSKQQQQ